MAVRTAVENAALNQVEDRFSGLVGDLSDQVEEALRAAGLTVAARKEKRGWVCFVCTAA